MFSKALLVGAFAALAAAQQGVSKVLFFTRVPNPVTAGTPIALTYSTNDTSTPVTIILQKGVSTNLQPLATLTSSAMDGQYIWTPSEILENASDYALYISQGTQYNYFGPFTIQGATGVTSSTSASSYQSTTASMTLPVSYNTTMTSAVPSMGTGTSMTRNVTMSRPTLTSSRTSHLTNTATSSQTTNTGAGFQTTTGSAPRDTNGASPLATGSSAIALVFGAVAAIFFC